MISVTKHWSSSLPNPFQPRQFPSTARPTTIPAVKLVNARQLLSQLEQLQQQQLHPKGTLLSRRLKMMESHWLTARHSLLSWWTKRYIMTFFWVSALTSIHFRLLTPTQSISSTKRSLSIQMGLLVSLATSISNAIMATASFSPSRGECEAALMVSTMFYHFTLTHSVYMLGLVNHLRVHFPAMHCLYLVLKERSEGANEDEIVVAQGWKPLDPTKASEYLQQLETASANITQMFAKQSQRAAVSLHIWFKNYCSLKPLSERELGPGKIWTVACWVDGCLWSAFPRGWTARTSAPLRVHTLVTWSPYPKQYNHQAKSHENGRRYCWRCQTTGWSKPL